MSAETPTDLVLGTAGHIDHGKSSLVQALTGVDPDRLAEEKQRGITIELGFAQLILPDGTKLGVVDVPGHERFVRQMIAGSTGIDLALLCIAADDGIMPQTVEHLAILELLGIPTCVIALTKADLVDEEWLMFMIDDVRCRLADTPYANAEIVAVSSRTGQGLSELKTALSKASRTTRRKKTSATLRLPVDRVFTIKGAGTVVTGTLWSGEARAGNEVEVLPGGQSTRIRGVQVHGHDVESAQAGHRVALNLNALSTLDIRPGDFLTSPGVAHATDHFDADVTYLGAPGHNKPLESGTRVHIAHGTREVTGRILFMDGYTSLPAGEHRFAQIRLDEPLPVIWRDRFIVRSYSPMHVVGGGVVLRAHPRRTTTLTDADRALLEALRTSDETAVAQAAFNRISRPISVEELAASSGLDKNVAKHELETLVEQGHALRLEEGAREAYYVSKPALQKHLAVIENALLKFHSEQSSATGISKDALRQRCLPHTDTGCFDVLLAYAVTHNVAVFADGEVSHPKAGAGARKMEEQAVEKLHTMLASAAEMPPTLTDIIAKSDFDASLVHRALGVLEKQGCIRRVDKDFYFDTKALASLEASVRTCLADGPATAAELKEAMGTSRKYAIPLLEYFDMLGITRRDGDRRMLGK